MFLMLVSKSLIVTYPFFLKLAIDGITCDPILNPEVMCASSNEIYLYIGMYGGIKFSADFINYIRELPFANVMASAECHIANMVYKHTQD